MFKFRSYNVKKEEKKNENKTSSSSSSTSTSGASSYSTGTLKKTTCYVSPKTKKMPSANEIKAVSNKQSPDYSRKIYPKKTVTDWHSNKTFSAKKDNQKETTKVVIPSPHKKLERK